MNTVRTRHQGADAFGNARGHDYIRLRGLAPKVERWQPLRMADACTCGPCMQTRQLPAVLQLLERWDRPAPGTKRDTRVVPLRRKK